ncbi:MAG TPA: thiamine pyrophosphate-dependent enzyme [Tissierellaceae bacterium]|nr:thiamine pyrophosphate-dependent enzyme [Tissierellaceae bacterium]
MKYVREDRLPTFWCAGCGYGQVMKSILMSLEDTGATRENTVIVSGIGCWGHVDSYLNVNAFHGTHGRALAFATGIKLANPDLNVIVVMGDGDGVTIGGNHFIHASRRNLDVTAIVCNNYNYGMTGGQYSGTTPRDSITTTSRFGHIEDGFDICKLAEAAGAPYVGRSISESVGQTSKLITEGMKRKGFSMIEVIAPCTTHFGGNNDLGRPSELYKWLKDKTVPVKAFEKMTPEEQEGKIVIGKLVDRPELDYGTKYHDLVQSRFENSPKKEGNI